MLTFQDNFWVGRITTVWRRGGDQFAVSPLRHPTKDGSTLIGYGHAG